MEKIQNISQFYKEKELTEGEEIIMEYFIAEGIKFKANVKIEKLKGDTNKSYREADFYLPEFGLYVEFFGQWNVNEDHKKRYREKKQVYETNDIPCVYLYPENLAMLKYVFNNRARIALKKCGTKKGQIYFGWYQFNFNIRLEMAVIFGCATYLLHTYGMFNFLHYLIFDLFVAIALLVSSFDVIRSLIFKFQDR